MPATQARVDKVEAAIQNATNQKVEWEASARSHAEEAAEVGTRSQKLENVHRRVWCMGVAGCSTGAEVAGGFRVPVQPDCVRLVLHGIAECTLQRTACSRYRRCSGRCSDCFPARA